jgi:hypothetical protein
VIDSVVPDTRTTFPAKRNDRKIAEFHPASPGPLVASALDFALETDTRAEAAFLPRCREVGSRSRCR